MRKSIVKSKQLNIRLNDVNYAQLILLEQAFHCTSHTFIIECAINSLANEAGISLDDVANFVQNLRTSQNG